MVGTGLGERNGRPCIRILVVDKTPELLDAIPTELDGHPVGIEETGELKALEDP